MKNSAIHERYSWLTGCQRLISPIRLLIVWEASSRAGLLPVSFISPPSAVLSQLLQLVRSGELAANLLASLIRSSLGLTLGILIGSGLAVLSGLSKKGELLIDPLIHVFRTLPILALAPLFVLWFGIDEASKIALITLGVIFPIYLNVYSGIKGVDPKLIEVAYLFKASKAELIRKIILPAALPAFFVGLRYALSVAWLILVVVEQFNAREGIGYMMSSARDFMRTDVIVICLIVYALLGLLSDAAVRLLEARLLTWRPALDDAMTRVYK